NIAEVQHPGVSTLNSNHGEVASSLFDGVGTIVKCLLDIGVSDPGGPRKDASQELARTWGRVARLGHVAIDAVVQDTGNVIGVVERTTRDQHGQFGVNVE